MDPRKRFILTMAAVLLLVAAAGFIFFLSRTAFTGVEFAALVATLVFLTLVGLLLDDVGLRMEMRLPRQFRRLGPGFGLVKALKAMTSKIDAVRARQSAGEIDEARAAEEESRLFEAFSKYFADRRWKQVEQLKRQGNLDDGKTLANRIREDHGL